jgi:Transglycosylase associated protein
MAIGNILVGGWIGSQLGINTDQGLASWLAANTSAILLLVIYHFLTARSAATARPSSGDATSDDYKRAVFDDLARGSSR